MSPKKFFYILSGLLIIALGGVGYIYYSLDSTLYSVQREISQKDAELSIAGERTTNLINLEAQLARNDSNIKKLDSALPAQKNTGVFAAQLQSIARNAQMEIKQIDFTASQMLPDNTTSQTIKIGQNIAVPVSFELVGNYRQLIGYLKAMESLERVNGLVGLEIVPLADDNPLSPTQNEEQQILTFKIKVNAYLKP